MVEKLLKNCLEEIEDDFSFVQFLLFEEKFSYNFAELYENLYAVIGTVDFDEELKNIEDSYNSFQAKMLEHFNNNMTDSEVDEFLEEVDDVVDALDTNDEIQKYVATRLEKMDSKLINYFICGVSFFQRTNDEEAWFKKEPIKTTLKNKIAAMNCSDIIILLQSSYNLFYDTSEFTSSVINAIEKMNDTEFSYFRHAIFFSDELSNSEISDLIYEKGEEIKSTLLYLDDPFINSKTNDEIEEKVKSFKNFDFLSLMQGSVFNFNDKLKYINDNLTILLYMLANPLTYLKETSPLNGVSYPYRGISKTIKKKVLEKSKNFTPSEMKILLASTNCYEKTELNPNAAKIVAENFKELYTTIEDKDIYIAKKFIDLAISLNYTSMMPVEIETDDDYILKDNDLIYEINEKYLLVENGYDIYEENIELFSKYNEANLIELISLFSSKKTKNYLEESIVLTNYIKYKILKETDKSTLLKLLFLDFNKIPEDFIEYINVSEIKNNLLTYSHEEDNKKKIL